MTDTSTPPTGSGTDTATVTLTIDGQPVTVPEGTLVIRAAETIGIEIPRFCDHPLLKPVGACRQCLVDIPDAGNGRGFPKPQASCTIPVAAGMVVNTSNGVAAKAQAGIMEFLLINHPLDCPVCDKGGECPLQNQAMQVGAPESRFTGPKRTFEKPIPVSPTILLDRERCVLCQRCTRFATEIAEDSSLVLIERGGQQQVGTVEGRPFLSPFSGNVIDICPVGALTSADYRFRSRPFDLVSVDTVAEHDACGAAIRVDHRRGRVMRRVGREDPEVNELWITDRDRFGFGYLTAPERLTMPLVRDPSAGSGTEGELRPASWPEALAMAARGLADGPAAVLTGGRITLEDARAYAGFARETLGTTDIDFRVRPVSAEETGFLARVVRGADLVTYADLEAADVVVVTGIDPFTEAGTLHLRLRKAARSGVHVVYAGPAGLGDLPEVSHRSVILAGEHLVETPGALSAAEELAATRGARLAWVPLRAGDRGAVEAGCFPYDGGRDRDQIIDALRRGDIGALLVGGVADLPLPDPGHPDGQRPFVVSLELRETAVTRAADVVLPVAPVTDKAGTFLTWEGRERPFPRIFDRPASYSDARVLGELARLIRPSTGSGTVLEAVSA